MVAVITINRPDVVESIEVAAERFTKGNKTEAVALAIRTLLSGGPEQLKDGFSFSSLSTTLGPLASLLSDSKIIALAVNGPDKVFIKRGEEWEKIEVEGMDRDRIERIVKVCISLSGRDTKSDIHQSMTLPDGCRVEIVPVVDDGQWRKGHALVFRPSRSAQRRNFDSDADSFFSGEALGSGDKEGKDGFIKVAVRSCGSTVLKTAVDEGWRILAAAAPTWDRLDLLEAMAGWIPNWERVAVIESREEGGYGYAVKMPSENVVRIEVDAKAGVNFSSALVQCSAMNVDRVVVFDIPVEHVDSFLPKASAICPQGFIVGCWCPLDWHSSVMDHADLVFEMRKAEGSRHVVSEMWERKTKRGKPPMP